MAQHRMRERAEPLLPCAVRGTRGWARCAAPIPEIDQRLTDTLQIGLNLRVGVQVILYVVTDLAPGLPLEPGEERVHVGTGE